MNIILLIFLSFLPAPLADSPFNLIEAVFLSLTHLMSYCLDRLPYNIDHVHSYFFYVSINLSVVTCV